MTTKKMKVVLGEKGYVPVKSNSHGGMDLGIANNGEFVYQIVEEKEEYGYVQVDKRIVTDLKDVNVQSPTGQYWIEKSHLLEMPSDLPYTGERYQLLGIDYSVTPPIVTLKKV